MVENVAKKVNENGITRYNLTACKICKPPQKSKLTTQLGFYDKSVGETVSVQCKGYTKKGTRCKHKTRLANGYCYQHPNQNNSSTYYLKSNQNHHRTSSTCGAKNKSGGYCKRKVKNGGRCHQHR